jgi:DNA invertase Pin-like site-specific DNA recombinase
MKRAIGYLRVSGASQVEKGGEARQRGAVIAFCAVHNLSILDIRFEAGVSGTVDGLDRPEFVKVLERIAKEDEEWDGAYGQCVNLASEFPNALSKDDDRPCIVVERLDRLARDLMVQEVLLKECRERGIKIYAADQGLIDLASNETDPTRVLFRQIMGALAQWEKSALVLKLRKSREKKRTTTGRCEGPPPFGHTPGQRALIQKILQYKAEGLDNSYIASLLNDSGAVSYTGKLFTRFIVYDICRRARKEAVLTK